MKRLTLVGTMRSGRVGAAVWALGAVALAVGCGDLVIAEDTKDVGVLDVAPDAGCRVMTCNPDSGECEPVDAPDDEACDPGDPCVVEATCQEGECVGAAVDCSELNGPCATGVCEGGSCEVVLTAEGQSCVPADECVIEATCTAGGSCVGKWDVDSCACVSAEDCDDGQACTIDGCDGDGVCQYEPVAVEAGSVGGEQTVCPGATPAGLTSVAGAAGGVGEWTYQWQSSADGEGWAALEGATGEGYAPGALTATTWFRRQAVNPCATVASEPVVVMVAEALEAGAVGGGQTICHGATPSQLTVSAASGGSGGFTYQWQSSPNGSTWSNIAGATGASYQPGALTANTQYRRVATNGCGSVESATIAIAVHGALNAGSVSANQSICSGATPAALTGSSPSGGTGSFSYQWQSSANGTSWSNVSGATSSSYAPGAQTTTTQFRRVASNSCGSATSNAVTVTVASGLTSGGIGNPQSICYGGDPSALSSTSTASGGLGDITYQWQQRPSGGSWSNISGATSTTYNPGALTTTTDYRRQASNTCGTATSDSVTVTVSPQLSGGAVGHDQYVCLGGGASTFTNVTSASGGLGSIAYQWQRRQGANAWEDISGATSTTYKPSNLPYEYRRAASNSCGTAYSNTVTVELLPYEVCNPCDPICP